MRFYDDIPILWWKMTSKQSSRIFIWNIDFFFVRSPFICVEKINGPENVCLILRLLFHFCAFFSPSSQWSSSSAWMESFLNSLWLVILTSIVMTIDCCHYRMLTKPWMEINDTLCDTVPYMEIVSTHKLSWHLMFVSVFVANLEWSRYWNCSRFTGEPITKFGQYLLQ